MNTVKAWFLNTSFFLGVAVGVFVVPMVWKRGR